MGVAAEMIALVKAGDADGLRRLLADDPAAAEARGEGGESPLLIAMYHGRRDLAELMLAHGRQPDAFEAAALGVADRLRAALDAEPGLVTRYTRDGWTLLHLAAFFGQVDAVRLLLERGADPNAVSINEPRNTPLHAGLAGPLAAEGVRLMLDRGAEVNARQHGGFVPLHAAAARGDLALIGLLLERGADLDAATDDGRRAVDLARERGHGTAAEHLLARGASA